MVTCLRGHTGLVKGLTWDPVGKYIASQADDHSLKVWRTVDWQMDANITKPFSEVQKGCSSQLCVLMLLQGWTHGNLCIHHAFHAFVAFVLSHLHILLPNLPQALVHR